MIYDSHNARKLRGIPLSATAPTDGQVLLYDAAGNVWKPGNSTVADGSITSAKLDASILKYAAVTVSSAEIKGMFGSVKTLLPAQGAGTIIEIAQLFFTYIYATATYVNGAGGAPTYVLTYDLATGPTVAGTTGSTLTNLPFTLRAAGSRWDYAAAATGTGGQPSSGSYNKPVLLWQPVAANRDLVTGDGTLDIRILYRVHSGLS